MPGAPCAPGSGWRCSARWSRTAARRWPGSTGPDSGAAASASSRLWGASAWPGPRRWSGEELRGREGVARQERLRGQGARGGLALWSAEAWEAERRRRLEWEEPRRRVCLEEAWRRARA